MCQSLGSPPSKVREPDRRTRRRYISHWRQCFALSLTDSDVRIPSEGRRPRGVSPLRFRFVADGVVMVIAGHRRNHVIQDNAKDVVTTNHVD
jgi:hypothetical protein